MKTSSKLGLVIAIAVWTVFVTATATTAQTLSAELARDWQTMRERMVRIADAMPADRFDYASTPDQRTFSEQILHIAGANVMLLGFLGAEVSQPAIALQDRKTFGYTATSKPDVLQALSASFDYGESALQEFNDEDLLQGASGPPFLGQPTRVRLVYFAISHAWNIYGQMAVYLRLNDIVPPASRGGV